MTRSATSTGEHTGRIARRRVDKFEERRRELGDAALQTLSELGYARTSLRDIAQNSGFSHGVLHYYFHDKFDLITYCVRRYKAVCVQRYDDVVTTASTASGLAAEFAAAMVATLVEDAVLHRLWYDLRSQSLFEESFRADVAEIDASLERMIERVVRRYAELAGTPSVCGAPMAYAMFDGIFQQALLRQLSGDPSAPEDLRAGVVQMLAVVTGTCERQ
ncbi:TetR family transcriptional regulator [Pseudonocardia sulfidoxydans NBRC 16205]|uniref:TetR family transcriptional regulator n=1 Tax=Pseudonocardia sulfidoxydans NBRC 16205 TaxID=1223511 RepID=A0A511DIY1_9PSEU|nr:TetR/AcrR family transcriptional regulator [Pseudonocardia sulfidoxydans]GEL24769.1 TetR family transcriptional regulator [Pseudonocardia sulfidoxydans NBRC 16205]